MSDGTVDRSKGKVKEAAGDLTDDQSLKNEGKVDKASGRSRTRSAAPPTRSRTRSTPTTDGCARESRGRDWLLHSRA